MSTGRRSSEMQDSLGLMQFQDQSSYLYGGSAGNLPLQHHLLHHHQQGFAHGRERFTGKDHVPELLFAEPAAEAGEQDLAAACKEVSSEGCGHMTKRRGRDGEGRGGGPRRADDRTTDGVRGGLVGGQPRGRQRDAAGAVPDGLAVRFVVRRAARGGAAEMSSWVGVCVPPSTPRSGPSTTSRRSRGSRTWRATRPSWRRSTAGARSTLSTSDMVPGGALQWLSLLLALASRPGSPPLLRVTGFGASAPALRDAGNQLAGVARKLGVPFEFCAVAKRPGEAVNAAADVPFKRPGEAVAVHWLHHALYDAAGDDGATMRLVRWLEPKVLTLVEQERGGCHFLLKEFFWLTAVSLPHIGYVFIYTAFTTELLQIF
jgi:hypothetical protein